MTNSKIFIQNTTKMIHLKKYIRKVKHAAPILYFVWQFCLNQWELIQYNLSFPFYWSRTYLSHQTSHRNVSGPQIFPLSQPYKFSDSMCTVLTSSIYNVYDANVISGKSNFLTRVKTKTKMSNIDNKQQNWTNLFILALRISAFIEKFSFFPLNCQFYLERKIKRNGKFYIHFCHNTKAFIVS